MSGTEFDDFLNKFVKLGEPIKPEKFLLDLMVGEDQTSNVKQDFKDKFLIPFFNKIELFNKELDKNIKESSEISNEFKSLKEEIKKSKPQSSQDVKYLPAVEQKIQTSSEVQSASLQEPKQDSLNLIAKYTDNKELSEKITNNTEQKSKTDTPHFLSEYIDDEKIAEKIANITNITAKNNTEIGQEQKTLGPKETFISFSKDAINVLDNITGRILEKDSLEKTMLAAKLDELKDGVIGAKSQGGIMGFVKDLFSSLPMMLPLALAAIGGTAVLTSMFWPEIKKFISDKFGDKASDIFDQFHGTVNAIGKFFTMGAVGATGSLLKVAGQAFTTFADLLEGGLSAVFKLGFGDDMLKAGINTAPKTFKSLIPKIAGRLFSGMGAAAMKGIPLIGSALSFYFAWDRFEKGDVAGGIIDLVGGVANLLEFTPLAPLALPLSLGAAALNGFLDYKTAGKTTEEAQSIKMDYMGKIVEFIQEIPIVGGLIKFGRGFYELAQGNFKGGLDYLTKTPFLGPFPAILQGLVNSNAFGSEGSGEFSWDKFQDETRKSMFRWMCSFIPKVGGLRGRIAKWYGLEYDDNTGDIKVDDTIDFSDENKSIENKSIKKSAEPLDPNKVKYSEENEKKLLDLYNEQRKLEKERKEKYEKLKEESLGGWNPFADEEAETTAKNNWEGSQANLTIISNKLAAFRKLKPKDSEKNSSQSDQMSIQTTSSQPDQKSVQAAYDEAPLKTIPIQDGVSGEGNSAGLFKDALKYSSTSSQFNGLTFQSPNDQKINVSLDRQDQMVAMKQGGAIDNTFKDLKTALDMLSFNLTNLIKTTSQNQQQPRQQPVVINNNSTEKSFDDHIKFSSERDEICNSRLEWIRGNTYARII